MKFMHRASVLFISIAAIAGSLLQCACDPVHNGGPKFMGNQRITPRSRWVASGDLQNLSAATDGAISTAAVSGRSYRGAQITFDLGKPCLFNLATIEHGPDEFGYCRRVSLLISNDGRNFTQQATIPGLRRVTTISLIRPVLARYVRIRVAQPGSRAWSVAEVHLD